MNNLFQIVYDYATQKTDAAYEKYIIRKVTKKEEEKLMEMGRKYDATRQKLGIPKWVYLATRVTFFAMLFSLVLWIYNLSFRNEDGFQAFITQNLWLEIIFLIAILSFISLMIVAILIKKKKQKTDANQKAVEMFEGIVEQSKRYLNVPKDAKSLEVLMEQLQSKNGVMKKTKYRTLSNLILSVFIEKNMLCLADLYSVIGIPLSSISEIKEVEHSYHFPYWHKKEAATEYKNQGIQVLRSLRCYAANSYYAIELNMGYSINIPVYELEDWKSVLQVKDEQNDSKSTAV